MSTRVHYGAYEYTVTDRSVATLREQIEQALSSGAPYWLPVRHGEGRPSDALLLITPGVNISLVAQNETDHDEEPVDPRDQ